MEERWRLFVALAIGKDARQAGQGAQEAARRAGYSARWVKLANAHRTLKFLGDTDSKRVASLGAALGEVAASSPAFTLRTARIGGFPNLRRPSVLWLGLGVALDQLAALQLSVEAALVRHRFPTEVRPFSPHLTLGRLSRGTALPAPDIVATLAANAVFAGAALPVEGIQLLRSELARSGARYTTPSDLPLAGMDR